MSEKKPSVKKKITPVVVDPKVEATTALIDALRDIHAICSNPRRRVGDVVPSGELSDALDEIIMPASAELNKFLAEWIGGRP